MHTIAELQAALRESEQQRQRADEEVRERERQLEQLTLKLRPGLSEQPTYLLTNLCGGGMGTRFRARELVVRTPDGRYTTHANPDKQDGYDPEDAARRDPGGPSSALLTALGNPRLVGRFRQAPARNRNLQVEWKWCADNDNDADSDSDDGGGRRTFKAYSAVVNDAIELAYQRAVSRGVRGCQWATPLLRIDLSASAESPSTPMFIRVIGCATMYTCAQTKRVLPAALQTRTNAGGKIELDSNHQPRQRLVVRFGVRLKNINN